MVIVDKWNNAMGNVSGWMMMILWLLLYHPQISGIGECGCLLYLWKCIFHPWSISRSSGWKFCWFICKFIENIC